MRSAGPAWTPAPTILSATLDQGAELGEDPVLVADELDLRDREVIALAGLHLDAFDHVRVDPVHPQRCFDQRLSRRVLAREIEQLHDVVRLREAVEVERVVRIPALRPVLREQLLVSDDDRIVLVLRRVVVLQVARADRAVDVLWAGVRRRGLHHGVDRGNRVDHDRVRLPVQRLRRRERAYRRRRYGEQDPGVGAGSLLARDLRRVARVRRLVALLRDDQALLRTEPDVQAAQVVLAVVIVLVEDRDLGVRRVPRDPDAVRAAFGDVVRLPADRPRELLVLQAPVARTGGDQDLRDLALVQHRADRLVVLRAEGADVREDLVLEDELVRQLNRLRRVVPIVVVLPDDLASVDARLAVGPFPVVDPVEVRLHAARDRRVQGGRPAERERPPDRDRRLRNAGCRDRTTATVHACEGAGNAYGERSQHRR